MKRGIGVVAGLLCVLGIGASVNHFLGTPYNPGFLEHPLITTSTTKRCASIAA